MGKEENTQYAKEGNRQYTVFVVGSRFVLDCYLSISAK
jgi:hypothetical protein